MLDGLYRLGRRDLDAAYWVLAGAFQDDPMFVYLFPDADERKGALPAIFKAIAGLGIAAGAVYAPSEAIEGCILVSGLGRSRTAAAILAALPDSLLLPLRIARHTGLRRLARQAWAMRGAVSQLRKCKDSLGDCLHIDLLAVDGPCRGRKLMSGMMRAVLAEADRSGVRCVLDTESEANLPVYEHFGFVLCSTIPVVPGRMAFHVMVREPAASLNPA